MSFFVALSSIMFTIFSASLILLREISHLGDSGKLNLNNSPTKASSAPIPYITLQPFTAKKPDKPNANGRPNGNGAGGVVNNNPNHIPNVAPRVENKNTRLVYFALPLVGATSPMYVLTIARSAPTPMPVMVLAITKLR
ncbi:hypothetical membrane protein [Sulfolobus acidocaldarius DSM 639]|uniref:Hypothetical membrane protein n=1 Tax=Sulfolobus acidocaldarius (strain ATCC 33909 / DSM 639 / JCM 8929 / NBRC 15157 / NCIMB 11770) TaxID=330779 RepID=Q4J7Z3_SULAC|nr:hypothetical membrane protein [Sulfolobus acidocaldarius DSM 639]